MSRWSNEQVSSLLTSMKASDIALGAACKSRLVILFALCWSVRGVCAQEWLPAIPAHEPLPTIRILPEDVVQTSIKQGPGAFGTTNKFTVRWEYTEAGAKKMLAFWREHAGREVLQQVGDFESQTTIWGTSSPGWTEEGWLKRRTDKFFAVGAEDAAKIIAGLKGKHARVRPHD
jgi:hypothetical protein